MSMVNQTNAGTFNPDYVYNPRISFDKYGFLPENPFIFDIITGRDFSIMNELGYICSEQVNQEEVLAIYKQIDLPIPKQLFRYQDQASYNELLKRFEKQQKKLVMQYPHLPKRLTATSYHVDPTTILALSNKKDLAKFVHPQYVVKRTVSVANSNRRFPCVVKTLDGKPTAGGYGVKICYSEAEFLAAISFFEESDYIVEDYIESEQNLCIQFFCDQSGKVQYLGATKQLIDSEGTHQGNIISNTYTVAEKIIAEGYSIMTQAYQQGYYGYAGFDVLVDRNQNFYFIDLNFRINASTAALLLKDYVSNVFGKEQTQLTKISFPKVPYKELLKHLQRQIDKKHFLPLSVWNPEGYSLETDSSAMGLLLFNDPNELKKLTQELQQFPV